MIGTIGSLVQETSNRRRWILSVCLYSAACVTAATLLGAGLGGVGQLLARLVTPATVHWVNPHAGAWFIGSLALAYAVSDLGLLRMPRPILREAVPITWWRAWRPYGAAVAYGAALGTGVMTRVPFGSFYILCLLCVLKGDVVYGGALIGTYGAARALTLLPASWGLYCHRGAMAEWLSSPIFSLWRAQRTVVFALGVFGTLVLLS